MNIIVTGSNGFLGQHLMAHLRTLGYDPYGVSSKAYDLRQGEHIDALLKHTGKPDIIFHLAAHVGGIQYNIEHPAELIYDNLMMNTQLIHKAMLAGCGKFVMVGSVCSYPEFNPTPTAEHRLWCGYPEPSNGPYGTAKLITLDQLKSYRKQYGFKFAYPVLSNLYGPGGKPDDHKSHVIPALIRRFIDNPAKVTIWGDGSPTRDFLYVKDAAEALTRYIEIDCDEPINIASGVETSIKTIVKHLIDISGYRGEIEYDLTRPNGQLRRGYDTYLARSILNWKAKTNFKDGLKETYANYCNDQR